MVHNICLGSSLKFWKLSEQGVFEYGTLGSFSGDIDNLKMAITQQIQVWFSNFKFVTSLVLYDDWDAIVLFYVTCDFFNSKCGIS